MLLGVFRDSIAHKWGDGNNTSLQNRIFYSIVAGYATIMERKYTSAKKVPDSLLKIVKKINLIRVNAEDYPLGDSNLTILRTDRKIPKALAFKDYSQFNFVGPTSVAIGWSYIPFEQIEFIKYRRFSSRDIYFSYYDDYIFVINWPGKELRFKYVPENIVDFKNFATNENEDTIDDDDIEIPDSLVEGIEGLVEERRFKQETGKEDAEINING